MHNKLILAVQATGLDENKLLFCRGSILDILSLEQLLYWGVQIGVDGFTYCV